MPGFAIVIGKCLISPPSPKLALLLVMWMYGAEGPTVSYDEYKQAYIANGGQRVEFIEQCFKDWTP